MEQKQSPEAREVSAHLEQLLPLLGRIIGLTKQSNQHSISLSAEIHQLHVDLQAGSRRQSALLALILLLMLGGVFLGWQLVNVSTKLDRTYSALLQGNEAARKSQEQLSTSTQKLEQVLKTLDEQTAAVKTIVATSPRVTVDERGQLNVEVSLSDKAAAVAAKRRPATAPTPTEPQKAKLPISNGRVGL